MLPRGQRLLDGFMRCGWWHLSRRWRWHECGHADLLWHRLLYLLLLNRAFAVDIVPLWHSVWRWLHTLRLLQNAWRWWLHAGGLLRGLLDGLLRDHMVGSGLLLDLHMRSPAIGRVGNGGSGRSGSNAYKLFRLLQRRQSNTLHGVDNANTGTLRPRMHLLQFQLSHKRIRHIAYSPRTLPRLCRGAQRMIHSSSMDAFVTGHA